MYAEVIGQCADMLDRLEGFLDKAETFAKEKSFDPTVFLHERLAPDMYPLIRQIQAACDYGKGGAAALSGQAAPRHPDHERTIGDARTRIRDTTSYMRGFTDDDFEGAGDRMIRLPWRPDSPIGGRDYLLKVIFPNVYFHSGNSYAILRKGGVDVGKLDFLGDVYRHER